MSSSIELEIRTFLSQQISLETVARNLIEKLEKSNSHWSEENLNSFYNFLLRSGQPRLLIDFILKNIKEKKLIIPWGHFIEAVQQLYDEVPPELIQLFKKGIKETDGKYKACQSLQWDALIGDMDSWRSQKNWEFSKRAPLLKKELLEKLLTLRTQQLFVAENELLRRLGKMFPGDSDVEKELQDIKERYAYEVLNRYSGLKKADLSFEESKENSVCEIICQSLIETAKANPEMSVDLAIAALMLEDYESSYQILQYSELTTSAMWLQTELQLKTLRHVELLEDLVQIEMSLSDDPETFFATALLRAQAFWGLGQKHTAIEILEGVLTSRPSYRSASVLLDLWRTF
ncbi:MAG: hypothetical protein AABY64_11245 [Bdellovibrionota bacterium]